MESKRLGRPKSKQPVRDKNINFRVSLSELNHIQKICNDNDLRYIDIFFKGLEHWSIKK